MTTKTLRENLLFAALAATSVVFLAVCGSDISTTDGGGSKADTGGESADTGAKEDAGTLPEDAGQKEDTGTLDDTGTPDDAGTAVDTGSPIDAGTPDDAGTPTDTGSQTDSGTAQDGGTPVDTGAPDTGMPDAGTPDAGTPDAGQPDAGTPDAGTATDGGLNPNPPASPVKLIFIHHSTGENWLNDSHGQLGTTLRDNNYFVSDTNYGWGPDAIGDTTDIGHWYSWFRGPGATKYMTAVYAESGQNCSYSRKAADPGGLNQIVMFKSCFPNSALQGGANDPVPAIGSNQLKGQDASSQYHTVANAKGIYVDILEYFKVHQDKLFIVVAAPPLQDATWSSNARAFNQWLVNDWLKNYPHDNVIVFDFYNVLTTNGGNADTTDLDLETGNHHRFWKGAIQHKTDGDNDGNGNVLEYDSGGDDHPSPAGGQKASAEFIKLLNIAYHKWSGK